MGCVSGSSWGEASLRVPLQRPPCPSSVLTSSCSVQTVGWYMRISHTGTGGTTQTERCDGSRCFLFSRAVVEHLWLGVPAQPHRSTASVCGRAGEPTARRAPSRSTLHRHTFRGTEVRTTGCFSDQQRPESETTSVDGQPNQKCQRTDPQPRSAWGDTDLGTGILQRPAWAPHQPRRAWSELSGPRAPCPARHVCPGLTWHAHPEARRGEASQMSCSEVFPETTHERRASRCTATSLELEKTRANAETTAHSKAQAQESGVSCAAGTGGN